MRYWVNTVSRDHVQRGVDGGFTQAGHGKGTGLKRMARGDRMVFYSPRTALDGGEPLQAFTALGTIADDAPFQVEMTPDFRPWRRKIVFATSKETPIRPLIDSLDFIRNKKSWGFVFRRGLFAIEERDFQTIERAMTASLAGGTSPPDDTS